MPLNINRLLPSLNLFEMFSKWANLMPSTPIKEKRIDRDRDCLEGGIGYVLNDFPKISEKFILNEILALESRGECIAIFSIEGSQDYLTHESIKQVRAPIYYIACPGSMFAVMLAHLRCLHHSPFRYLCALFQTLQLIIRSRPIRRMRSFIQAGYIADLTKRLGLRHLHAHFATRPAEVVAITARIVHRPYSFTAHAYDIYKNSVDRSSLIEIITKARFVVTISDWNKAFLNKLVGSSFGHVERIYNGIDLKSFHVTKTRLSKPFTVLTVARLVEKKGLDVLIDAVDILCQRKRSFRYCIVGDGPYRGSLENRILRLGLTGMVELLGAKTEKDVIHWYENSHIFVLPCIVANDGDRDGLPVAIVEALACSLPVVTTAVTGIPEAVCHGRNGLIVPERDPEALADAIDSLAMDSERYAKLSDFARRSVMEKFDLSLTSEKLHRLFSEVSA